jgi:hypothetical protein
LLFILISILLRKYNVTAVRTSYAYLDLYSFQFIELGQRFGETLLLIA